ncbi:MAG: hypothetical protein ACFB11_00875 [Paracoccaceae bacterium]
MSPKAVRPNRLPDWQHRLVQYLQSVQGKPIEPGQHDCALFLADGIEAVTGQDLAGSYRGKYDTFSKGVRLMRKEGLEDHVGFFRNTLKEIPLAFALPGDGAVVEMADGLDALGIVQGEYILLLDEQKARTVHVPLLSGSAAFEV